MARHDPGFWRPSSRRLQVVTKSQANGRVGAAEAELFNPSGFAGLGLEPGQQYLHELRPPLPASAELADLPLSFLGSA